MYDGTRKLEGWWKGEQKGGGLVEYVMEEYER
jgi:hypothetical protein